MRESSVRAAGRGVSRFRLAWVFGFGLACCVPEDPPGGPRRPGRPIAEPKPQSGAVTKTDPALRERYFDDFERERLGPDYRTNSAAWRIVEGKLCGTRAHNRPVWLARRIPVNARIEFDAVSSSPDGDIKVEVWGDGRSGATGTAYTNATSYLVIFGGWKNSLHVLARKNEHGEDRKELRLDAKSDVPRTAPVVPGQSYHFRIERRDGRTVRWFVDDTEILSLTDADPLFGTGHDHVGFNDWEAPVCFDNLDILPVD